MKYLHKRLSNRNALYVITKNKLIIWGEVDGRGLKMFVPFTYLNFDWLLEK